MRGLCFQPNNAAESVLVIKLLIIYLDVFLAKHFRHDVADSGVHCFHYRVRLQAQVIPKYMYHSIEYIALAIFDVRTSTSSAKAGNASQLSFRPKAHVNTQAFANFACATHSRYPALLSSHL